ncbi:hypothetical protein [Parabacteroides sp. PF5-6]|uniref:hypothetical protein n=1 Tax=Parabacteroides sp. PF5-6 TaxID=1742403 RepID=UPI002406EC54|nr:hypothetical protein [Parabacteroides sp. PF5-6]MDF9831770.1 hypothetical protein [Parabacteroides sp. PF5-6]
MKRIGLPLLLLLAFAAGLSAQSHTIFIFKDFTEAKVYFKNRSITIAPMNYDGAKGRMYFMQNDELMELTHIQMIDSIVWEGERKFITHGASFLDEVRLENGTLYIHWRLKDVNIGSRGALGATTQARVETISLKSMGIHSVDKEVNYTEIYERKNDNDYYLLLNGKLQRFKNSKQLSKLLPELKDNIETFAKEEKIDTKQTPDMIRLVNYTLSLN